MDIIFWQPTNSVGTAATLDTTFENQRVKINFYWSAPDLAIEPRTQEELLEEIRIFLERHPLTNLNGRNVFHLRRLGDDFNEITDPGWAPPSSR